MTEPTAQELADALAADDSKPWLTAPTDDDPVPPDTRLAAEPAQVTAQDAP